MDQRVQANPSLGQDLVSSSRSLCCKRTRVNRERTAQTASCHVAAKGSLKKVQSPVVPLCKEKGLRSMQALQGQIK